MRELYGILSDGLLELENIANMGEYYRKNDVFVFYSDRMDIEPDKAVPAAEIEKYIKILLEYISKRRPDGTLTDTYLVS